VWPGKGSTLAEFKRILEKQVIPLLHRQKGFISNGARRRFSFAAKEIKTPERGVFLFG
jgi:hypothetical protein